MVTQAFVLSAWPLGMQNLPFLGNRYVVQVTDSGLVDGKHRTPCVCVCVCACVHVCCALELSLSYLNSPDF